jgi:transcriptional regulator with XRE-family HTH domain
MGTFIVQAPFRPEPVSMKTPRTDALPALPELRDALRRKIEGASLRRVAEEVGMSPSGLQKFLDGSDLYRPTAARLRLWYRAQPENLDTLTATDAVLAIQLLMGGLPEEQRTTGTLLLIGSLSALYSSQPPSWLVKLRERYG